MNFIKDWWKILGAILTIYVLIAGFQIPLKPGIMDYSNTKAYLGTNYTVDIESYNTFLTKSETNVWLLLPDDNLIKASEVDVKDDNHVSATLPIPSDIEFSGDNLRATIVVDNEHDGFFIYPEAVRIRRPEMPSPINIKAQYHELAVLKSVNDFKFPFRGVVHETIRNTYFHVAIWMSMFLILLVSCYHSIMYLIRKDLNHDTRSASLTTTALVFGIAGIATGSMWAKYTWGDWWTDDVKLNMTAIALLIYFAYWILRASISDVDNRARLSSVFNLFSFACLMILVMVIPRLSEDSLHPGNGGNPAFAGEDLDNTMRAVFYPAIMAYALIGFWISQIIYRFENLKNKYIET